MEIQAKFDAPVRQDDVLSVTRDDDGERIGFLHIDLTDGDMIAGASGRTARLILNKKRRI